MNRRSFLLALASATAFGVLMPYHKKLEKFNKYKKNSPLEGREEIEILTTLADMIYPSDDSLGASELGFRSYLLQKLQRDRGGVLQNSLFRLAQKSAQAQHDYHLLPEKLLEGALYSEGESDFSLLIEVTLEAVFSAPKHGGNRDKNSWKLLGKHFSGEWLNG